MMGANRLHAEKYHPEEVCQELIFFIVEPPYSIRAERRAIDADSEQSEGKGKSQSAGAVGRI